MVTAFNANYHFIVNTIRTVLTNRVFDNYSEYFNLTVHNIVVSRPCWHILSVRQRRTFFEKKKDARSVTKTKGEYVFYRFIPKSLILGILYKSFSPHCLSKYLTMSEFTVSFVSDSIGQQLCFGLIKSPVFAVDLFSGLSDLPDEW